MLKRLFKNFLILFLSVIPLQSQQLVDGIAAIVGQEIILFSDVQQLTMEMIRSSGVNPSSINQEQFINLQNQALRELINMEIILLQAEEDSIFIRDRDIQSSLDEQMKQYLDVFGSEEELEQVFGLSMRKIREYLYTRVKSSLIVQQIQAERFGNIKVSRSEVLSFYEENKDSIPDIPERVNISHILIIPEPSGEKKEQKRTELLEIKNRILSGEISFSEAAQTYSADRSSAVNGGELGFSPKGTFVPEFERAAFLLENKGDISDIVETQFGVHIIKLIERRGELINVAHILLDISKDESDNALAVNMLSTIRDSIINTGDFTDFAFRYSDDPDVKINKGNIGEFPLNTLQIEEFKSVAETLNTGEISAPFQTMYGFHILKLNNRKPSEKLSLKTHYNIIENMASSSKKQKEWNRWLDKLYEKFYVEIKR